jgi:DNA-binding protein HU-beta
MHVTKQEFVDKVADRANLSKRDAAEAVDAFLDSITDVLRGGGEVAFTGFGKFTTQARAARQGVNPRNPTQRVQIPATTVPKFSAGSQLKQAVKSGAGHPMLSTGNRSFTRAAESSRPSLFFRGHS